MKDFLKKHGWKVALSIFPGFLVLPFVLGGWTVFWIYSSTKNKLAKWALIFLVLLVTFFVGSAWVSAVFGGSDDSQQQSEIEQVDRSWETASLFSEAKVLSFDELPENIQAKALEKAQNEQLRLCNDWSNASQDRECFERPARELYYPVAKLNNSEVAYWSNLYACDNRECQDENLNEFMQQDLASEYSTYGKYANRWLFKRGDDVIEGREKFDGHAVLFIERNGSTDTVWFYPLEFKPSAVGIELYENLKPDGESVPPRFIDIQ